ncbi:hypothetical protein [Mycoplasma sp. E35C]|uniref:hypothetical protein n=1 Tax=Mycoplasma sp. E35C TaxID=2801918 RepID=UPI001CA3F0D9|nr:hypothetical protein [Mycoplasma sp. E35C]QZX49068.1 hypothetical protein JJE79_03355 [Mycoplasma sp. E35C]
MNMNPQLTNKTVLFKTKQFLLLVITYLIAITIGTLGLFFYWKQHRTEYLYTFYRLFPWAVILAFSIVIGLIFFLTKTKHKISLKLIERKKNFYLAFSVVEIIHFLLSFLVILTVVLLEKWKNKYVIYWTETIPAALRYRGLDSDIPTTNDWFLTIQWWSFYNYGWLSAYGWNIIWFFVGLIWFFIYLKLPIHTKHKYLSIFSFLSLIIIHLDYENFLEKTKESFRLFNKSY